MNAEGTEVFPILVYCSDYKRRDSAPMRQDEVRIRSGYSSAKRAG